MKSETLDLSRGVPAAAPAVSASASVAKITDAIGWKPHMVGDHAVVEFPNGYSASCLRGGIFYTRGGTYEIAVLHGGRLCYDTPITDDVLGYLSEDQANKALADIAALPAKVRP